VDGVIGFCEASMMSTYSKQTKLSDHIVKSIVKPVESKPFTTEPKSGRRKPKGIRVSLERAKIFMEHLYSKGLRECSYETLEFEFIQCFGTNEQRVLVKYLGRPARTLHYGSYSVLRVNKVNGKVAHFEYQNLRKVEAKRGLLEVLGFVSKKGERYVLHHELLPYCSKQKSIVNLCVHPIEAEEREQQHIGDE
jgi:hypothetical protein